VDTTWTPRWTPNQVNATTESSLSDTFCSWYGIKKAKDTDSLGKLFAAYLRRAEESVLGSVLIETTVLYMSNAPD
jgi:hypothetical protein